MKKYAILFSLLLAAAGSSQAQYAAWWRLDEGTGAVANDRTTNGNHGAITGGTWTTGKFNGALGFNGTSDLVNAGNGASVQITGSITLEAWIRPAAPGPVRQPIIAKWDDNGVAQRGYFIDLNVNNGLRARFDVSHNGLFGGGCTQTGNAFSCANHSSAYSHPLTLNQWYHVVGVFNSATRQVAIYVNGVLQSETTATQSNIFNSNAPVLIGSGKLGGDAQDYFNGSIDEPRIWNMALDTAYVQKLYAVQSLTYSKVNTGVGTVPIKSATSTALNFDIRVQNLTAAPVNMAGFQVWDVLPAEFDLNGAPVTAGCSVTASQPAGATKGRQPKLEPEFLSINFAGLNAGASCTVNVAAKTDENPASSKGNTPVKYEPTSCPANGKIMLNEGVRVFDTTLIGSPFEVIGPVSPVFLPCQQ